MSALRQSLLTTLVLILSERLSDMNESLDRAFRLRERTHHRLIVVEFLNRVGRQLRDPAGRFLFRSRQIIHPCLEIVSIGIDCPTITLLPTEPQIDHVAPRSPRRGRGPEGARVSPKLVTSRSRMVETGHGQVLRRMSGRRRSRGSIMCVMKRPRHSICSTGSRSVSIGLLVQTEEMAC